MLIRIENLKKDFSRIVESVFRDTKRFRIVIKGEKSHGWNWRYEVD